MAASDDLVASALRHLTEVYENPEKKFDAALLERVRRETFASQRMAPTSRRLRLSNPSSRNQRILWKRRTGAFLVLRTNGLVASSLPTLSLFLVSLPHTSPPRLID